MDLPREKLRLKDNKDLEKMISPRGRFQLRLVRVFRAIAQIAYEDMMVHPWKIPPYVFPSAGVGTATVALTTLYYSLSPTKKSREYRKRIKNAFFGDVNYKLYIDFMDVNVGKEYPLIVKTGDMMRHYRDQALVIAFDGLNKQLNRLPSTQLRRAVQVRLKKKLSKGELVPVAV